jgi:hypothetical protein
LNPKNELVYCYSENEKYAREVPIELSQRFPGKSHTSSDVYKFQVLDLNGKQYLRVDTTEKSIKSFYSFYRHNPQYEIVHLPGFRTKDRFSKAQEELYLVDSLSNWINLIKDTLVDYIHLYECTYPQDSNIQINLGKINTNLRKGYYQRTWFLNNFQKGVEIILPEGKFKPIYFELIISDSTSSKYYRTDNLSNPGFKNILNDFPDLCNVNIQNIIFLDKKGRKTRITNGYRYSVVK